MELDLGNVMGPQGPRGSLIYYGTAITGTSTSGTIFSGSGIANAMVDDKYLNTSTGDFYTCTTSGAPSVARWAWIVNLLGPQGNVGPAGPTGQIDENTPITFSTPSTYSAPASGNTIAVLFGKITKGLSDLFTSVAAKLDSSKVIASTNITQAGFVMDGKTCSDAIAQLNSNISTTHISLSDFCNYQGESIIDANIYQNGKTICIYMKLSGAKIQNNDILFVVNSEFKPATGYAILPIRGNSGPYSDKGSLWISGVSGSTQIYGTYSSDLEVYIYGIWVVK